MKHWREKTSDHHPDWLPFLDAVAARAAADALDAGDGDQASASTLADQAGAAAAVLLFGIEFADAHRAVVAIEQREGQPSSETEEDRRQVLETLQGLRDDPALLDAFRAAAQLLPDRMASAVSAAVDAAEALPTLHAPTRSRLAINAREAAPSIMAALEERLAPIWTEVRALEQRFASLTDGDEWKLRQLLADRNRLMEEVEQVEREFQVDALVEEIPDGKLVRIHRALKSFRARQDLNEDG